MANGQPIIQGGVNVASSPTSLAAPNITGNNRTAFSAYGGPVGTGLYGTAEPLGPGLLGADTGVIGASRTTGVLGVAAGGFVDDGNGNILLAASGVAGIGGTSGVGVHGSASGGFGVVGQDLTGTGVAGKSQSGPGVVGDSTTGNGVTGRSDSSIGVSGTSRTAQGVFGTSTSSAGVAGTSQSGSGVHGRSISGIGAQGRSQESIGVYGSGQVQPGVRGDSNSNYGVLGMSTTGNGVHGWSTQGQAGVSGYSPAQRGLYGLSRDGYGLWAESTNAVGVVGLQTSAQLPQRGAGVVGIAERGVGVAAVSQSSVSLYAVSANNLAARFDGAVEIRGSLQVVGGPKSAVVPHADGTHRQLYCMESPESWFEDFGEAQLANGRCGVQLDGEFAALVHRADYQVFLTPYDAAMLYVSRRTSKGFEVRAMTKGGGDAAKTARFGYRIVARRKDVDAPRLAKVTLERAPIDWPVPEATRHTAGAVPKAPRADREPKASEVPAVPPAPKAPNIKRLNSVFGKARGTSRR